MMLKTRKCPHCDNEIDHLVRESKVIYLYTSYPDPEEEQLTHMDGDTIEDGDTYFCPDCDEEIENGEDFFNIKPFDSLIENLFKNIKKDKL